MLAKFIDSILESEDFLDWWIRITFIVVVLFLASLVVLLVILTAPYSLFVVAAIAICVIVAIIKSKFDRG
jgi:uncharacterized membrane protein